MPPKKAASASGSASVFIVILGTSVDSVHASLESANVRVAEAKGEKNGTPKIEVQSLVGGSITVDPVVEKKPAKAKAKAIKKEDNEDKQAKTVAPKKTKTPAEQRAANATKPKGAVDESELPDNYKTLLGGMGTVLNGLSICVTGVPPTLGRKNAEKLVVNYGGKVASSLSSKTSYVVVGNDAGPTKLEKIETLGLTTLDEDGLVKLIEESAGAKRSADDEEEEDAKPIKTKKRKT
ncbi:putative replication factor C subunit 1 [Rhexocercosporidium sp. MPI-PUGE-AT-0058]|nr:putative replication factor C subunit 1 [Rhexocercosporidium sp. MPI-PUGE-AT-0058]